MTFEDLRRAVADALRSIPANQVTAYVPTNPNPPSIWVMPGPIEYDLAHGRGGDWVTLLVQAMSTGLEEPAQRVLDGYMASSGPTSVKEALERPDAEGRVTLGGLVDDVHVASCTGYRRVERTGGSALIVEWELRVLTSAE